MKNLKYLAVGMLVGYVGLYVWELTQAKLTSPTRQENKLN